MDKKKKTEVIKELAERLFELMGIKVKIDISEDKENEAVKINVGSVEETGLLIGRRGETLRAIQSVLGLMAKQETGDWIRIIVDVGDYLEKQESQLRELAKQAADKAIETGEPQHLYNLRPEQRRIIHLFLSGEKEIETHSEGEGEERYLVITTKES